MFLLLGIPNFKYRGKNKTISFETVSISGTNFPSGNSVERESQTWKSCRNKCFGFDFIKFFLLLFGINYNCVAFSHQYKKGDNRIGTCIIHEKDQDTKYKDAAYRTDTDSNNLHLYQLRKGVIGF